MSGPARRIGGHLSGARVSGGIGRRGAKGYRVRNGRRGGPRRSSRVSRGAMQKPVWLPPAQAASRPTWPAPPPLLTQNLFALRLAILRRRDESAGTSLEGAQRTGAAPRSATPALRRVASFAVVGVALAVAAGGCRSLPTRLLPAATSPRQGYLQTLEMAGLGARPLGAEWIAAARQAVAASTAIVPPYRETGYFDPARPSAVAFALDLHRGEQVSVQVATAPPDLPLFIELLRTSAETWEVLAAAADGRTLRYAPRGDERVVLVVQPEILAGGRYTIDLVTGGALLFPVENPESTKIISRFGSARNGGARAHQGIDIAAPRGTPALAAADGWILSASENELGGRIVRMRTESGLTLYYAHLDRQLVRGGERVVRGTAVGAIGDTGNARGTTPHLHFEVSDGDSPLDPEPWIRRALEPARVTADLARLGAWSRTTSEIARLRTGPATSFPIVDELVRGQAARVAAAARDWYRIELPDGRGGYTAASLIGVAETPLRQIALHEPLELRAAPARSAPPIARLEPGQRAGVLALAGETILVRGPHGVLGWTETP